MVIMTDDDDIERKPAKYTLLLAEQLNEAIKYLREKNPNQAEIMGKQFFKTVRLLETMPGIGTMCQNGMRKFKLGKFRYLHNTTAPTVPSKQCQTIFTSPNTVCITFPSNPLPTLKR